MEQNPTPPDAAQALAPDMLDTLAHQGLQSLLFAPVAKALAGFDRDQLGAAIEVMIAMLDAADGDPDFELNGDELDGSLDEDDFCHHNVQWLGQPGCPLSDPAGEDEQDKGIVPMYGVDQTACQVRGAA